MKPRTHVAGEEASPLAAFAFGVVGLGAAALTVLLVVSSAEAASPQPGANAPVAASAPSLAPSVSVSASVTAAAVMAPASSAEPPACAPLVVNFAFASASLDAAEAASVDELAAWLATVPEASVVVNGHADAFGKDDTNLAFSRSRALAVSSRLIAAGVARPRVTARGFGAYQPVEGAPEEAASNRRAVVYVKGVLRCPTPEAGDRR